MLLIARTDKGELELRVEMLDVRELLESVATRFEWRAGAAGRALVTDVQAGISVRGDRLRLEQALGNLVDNALRHGAGTVRLDAERAADHSVELHVRDEGDGFVPEFLPRAFERFTRAEPARSGGGSGLGLSIVRTIATAHGGAADAVNQNGGGADVWVTIPAASP